MTSAAMMHSCARPCWKTSPPPLVAGASTCCASRIASAASWPAHGSAGSGGLNTLTWWLRLGCVPRAAGQARMSAALHIGLVVNPLAGLGGSLALKGSDGDQMRELVAQLLPAHRQSSPGTHCACPAHVRSAHRFRSALPVGRATWESRRCSNWISIRRCSVVQVAA